MWTTLMNHMTCSDDEIYQLSGVNLVYINETTYGIIREIRAPQFDTTKPIPKPRGRASKKIKKVTCRDSSHGRKPNSSINSSKSGGSRDRKAQSLSESRRANYGITPSNVNTRSVCSSRRKIDYVSLNDGFDDDDSTPAKKCTKESFRPRSAPSATRLSAHKRMSSPEANELPAVPSASNAMPLTGVTHSDITLPDLVVNQTTNEAPSDSTTPAATNTIEDLEAASTLLSLGDTLEDTLDDDDDNALLMPIGGSDNPEDITPQPIRLDQVNVDRVIAEIVDAEQSETKDDQAEIPVDQPDNVIAPLPVEEPDKDVTATKKGSLKTKTYVLKKKPDTKRSFKCSECNVTKSTVQELNNHHHRSHNPQMCGICN